MILEYFRPEDGVELVIRDSTGKVKTTRYKHGRIEFIPNKFYISLINKGFIQPNKWKIPLLFGWYTVHKEITINGNN